MHSFQGGLVAGSARGGFGLGDSGRFGVFGGFGSSWDAALRRREHCAGGVVTRRDHASAAWTRGRTVRFNSRDKCIASHGSFILGISAFIRIPPRTCLGSLSAVLCEKGRPNQGPGRETRLIAGREVCSGLVRRVGTLSVYQVLSGASATNGNGNGIEVDHARRRRHGLGRQAKHGHGAGSRRRHKRRNLSIAFRDSDKGFEGDDARSRDRDRARDLTRARPAKGCLEGPKGPRRIKTSFLGKGRRRRVRAGTGAG